MRERGVVREVGRQGEINRRRQNGGREGGGSETGRERERGIK